MTSPNYIMFSIWIPLSSFNMNLFIFSRMDFASLRTNVLRMGKLVLKIHVTYATAKSLPGTGLKILSDQVNTNVYCLFKYF